MRGLFFVLSILLLSFISLFPPSFLSFLPPSLSFGLWLLSYPSTLGLLPLLLRITPWLPSSLPFLAFFTPFLPSFVPSFLPSFFTFFSSFVRSFVRSFVPFLLSFLPSSTLMPTNLLLWVETQVRSLSSSH